jgi:hydrogenase nickel incorporation protein HypA/HybF
MHEIQVMESILDIALKHAKRSHVKKIVSIHLEIGELSDLEDEWIQYYFDLLSKNTIARDAKLNIKKMPIVVQCDKCKMKYNVKKEEIGDAACPGCHCQACTLISGSEYYVKDMEAM